jgi:hypothetical protein
MKCAHCNNTGSLSKSLDGYLDCAHCDVAEERRKLESWGLRLASLHGTTAAMWLIHQHGKAAAGANN